MKRPLALGVVALGAAIFGVAALPGDVASAHPLGNFTINQYSGLSLAPDGLAVDLVTDMAEIPAYQTRGAIDRNGDGQIDDREAAAWAAQACADQAAHLRLELDGHTVSARSEGQPSLTFPPGQAGLPTLRLECGVRAPLDVRSGTHALTFANGNFDGRLGWRELTANAPAYVLLAADVPGTSVTKRLTTYPDSQLRSPLHQTTASLRFDAGVLVAAGPLGTSDRPAPSTPTGGLPRGVDQATRAFTSLVAGRQLTLAFALAAVALAIVLGALHALAPGHGKTVMAAYLVGERGSLRQAAVIGLTVTATHTAGVVVLGVLLTVSSIVAPERIYPWLGLASGILLAGIGLVLLGRARAMRNLTRPAFAVPMIPQSGPPSPLRDESLPALVGATASGLSHGSVGGQHHAHHAQKVDGEHHNGHGHRHGHDPGHDHHHDHDNHHHDHDHDHHHHDPDHDHGTSGHHDLATELLVDNSSGSSGLYVHTHGGRAHVHKPIDPTLGWKSLVAVGFAGGLLPSPSALVVLLGAIALGRTWFGLILVTAYGVGMAGMLTTAGLLLVRARSWLERRANQRSSRWLRGALLSHTLPLITALIIVVVGVFLAARATAQL